MQTITAKCDYSDQFPPNWMNYVTMRKTICAGHFAHSFILNKVLLTIAHANVSSSHMEYRATQHTSICLHMYTFGGIIALIPLCLGLTIGAQLAQVLQGEASNPAHLLWQNSCLCKPACIRLINIKKSI